MSYIIKLRRALAAEWASLNPVLSDGEPAFAKDTNRLKVGNGTSSWSQLDAFLTESVLNTAVAGLQATLATHNTAIVEAQTDADAVAAAFAAAPRIIGTSTIYALTQAAMAAEVNPPPADAIWIVTG